MRYLREPLRLFLDPLGLLDPLPDRPRDPLPDRLPLRLLLFEREFDRPFNEIKLVKLNSQIC